MIPTISVTTPRQPTPLKKGMAIPLVIFISVIALVFAGNLFRQGTQINLTNEKIFRDKYLDWANRGIMEVIKYKLKIMPTEFYFANIEFLESNGSSRRLLDLYLTDFSEDNPDMIKFDPDQKLGNPDDLFALNFLKNTPGTKDFIPVTLELRAFENSNLYTNDVYKITFSTTYKKVAKEVSSLVNIERRAN